MTAAEAARAILEALGRGEEVVEAVVVASDAEAVRPGARMLLGPDLAGGALGSLGTPEADSALGELAREVLRGARAGVRELALEGGTCSVFLEAHRPADELVIVGAGHIARPLCRMAAQLGFRVLVLDDRPGFATVERFPEAARVIRADFSDPFAQIRLGPRTWVVLVTRGHKYDFDALTDLLRREERLAYIGMVGSQRRVRAAYEQLVRDGIPAERLASVFSPIGLDLGAETPEEIAVSIAAELVLVRRGGTGLPLRDRARVVERWIRGGLNRAAPGVASEEETG